MQQTLLLIGIACVIGAVVGGGSKLAGVEIPLISSPLRQVLLALFGAALIGSVERVRLGLKALWRNQRLVLAVVAILGMFVGVTGTLITQRVLDTPVRRSVLSREPSSFNPGPAPGAIDSSGTRDAVSPSPLSSQGSPPQSPSTPVAPPGPSKYVAELTPVEGVTPSGPDTWTMNVTPYEHSIGVESFCYAVGMGYNLARGYRSFQATVGVTDDAPSDTRLRFIVSVDGTEKARRDVELGKPMPIAADVSGGLRLSLRVEAVSRSCFGSNGGTAVWGNPQIYQ